VTRLTGVHEKGGGASAREGGGNFAADVTGFAHAGHNDSALAAQNQPTGLRKSIINALTERKNGCRLIFYDPSGRCAEQIGAWLACFALSGGLHGVLYSHADIMPFLTTEE
jgi:hypothetical protein